MAINRLHFFSSFIAYEYEKAPILYHGSANTAMKTRTGKEESETKIIGTMGHNKRDIHRISIAWSDQIYSF